MLPTTAEGTSGLWGRGSRTGEHSSGEKSGLGDKMLLFLFTDITDADVLTQKKKLLKPLLTVSMFPQPTFGVLSQEVGR